MILKCKICETELSYANIAAVRDCDGTKVKGAFCKNCQPAYLENLKKERLAETYFNRDIYFKDGKYYPYWGSLYYFETIEDCKKRLDRSDVAIVPIHKIVFRSENKN